MIQKYIFLISLFVTAVFLSTCKKEVEKPSGSNKVVITSTTATDISYTSVKLSSDISNVSANTVISQHGHCWSTQPSPDISSLHTSLGIFTTGKTFSNNLTDLQPDTKYFVKAYAIINTLTIYGTELSFTTIPTTSPNVVTTSLTNINSNSALTGGDITSDGGSAVISRGVCWNTSSDPTITNSYTSDGSGIGFFESSLTGLLSNTSYHIRAYAINSSGTFYGNELTFTTKAASPSLSTLSVTSITQNSAISGGNIISDGGSAVTIKGVCWNTSQNPSNINPHTSDGTGIGTFISSITDLNANTTYYIRAYASNSMGTTYGNQISFSTTFPMFTIGQSYGGGIIFYIDGTGQHGLIASPNNQGGTPWGCVGTSIAGTSTSFGSGQNNTTAIINGCSTIGIAARLCNDLVLNSYSDWYLPSKDELNLMYTQKNIIGGFSISAYWSSSQASADGAWYQLFLNGNQGNYGYKTDANEVRAIRSF